MTDPASPQSSPSAPPPHTNVLAIVSLASAFVVSLAAVITGHIALSQIRRTGQKGRELALAGVLVGYAGILWSVLLAAMLVVVVSLGLASGWTPFHTSPGIPLAPQPTSGASPGRNQDAAPSDISFADGRDLSPDAVAQISDGMLGDRDWSMAGPKIEGTWGYLSKDGTCSVSFHQGALNSEVDVDPSDDLATTNSLLGSITGTGTADASDHGRDDSISLGQSEDRAYVDTRGLSRTDDSGRAHITVARAFAALKQGVTLDVSCATQDATVAGYEHVLSRTGLLVG